MVSSNDVSRLFLQSFISRRVLTDKLARVLWGKCVDAVKAADDSLDINHDSNKFDEFMNGLNARLLPLDLKMSVTVDEMTGKKIWAMVNTKGDELAQAATEYTAVEIAYFKAVVEQIVLAPSESYSISTLAALREVNGLKPTMTKSQAEVLLANFVARGWLIKSQRNRFSLSSRALLELQTYLKTNYEDDIQECTFCYELLTKGIGCHIPACAARLHDHCYKRFARESNICPSCRSSWSDPSKLILIGEGAVREGDYDGRRRMKKGDDEEDSDSEEELEPVRKATKTKGSGGSKSKKRQVSEEEDSTEDDMEVDEQSPPPEKSKSRSKRH